MRGTDLGVGDTAVVAGLGVGLVLAVAVAAGGTATHGGWTGKTESAQGVIRTANDPSSRIQPLFKAKATRNDVGGRRSSMTRCSPFLMDVGRWGVGTGQSSF